jgi:hypothetical protein
MGKIVGLLLIHNLKLLRLFARRTKYLRQFSSYSAFLLPLIRTRQLYHLGIIYFQRYPVSVAVLRSAMKDTHVSTVEHPYSLSSHSFLTF